MQDSDMRDDRKPWNMGQSAVDDVQTDNKGKVAVIAPVAKTAADKCSKCDCAMSECKCKEATVDAKKHAARLEQLYNQRLAAKVAELEKQKNDFVKTYEERFVRALKIVARRQALNLEHSPLKEAMGVALCNARDLGDGFEYNPMDQSIAVHLVEASFNEPLIDGIDKTPWEAFIDGMLERSASIMGMSDEALMHIEADLKNMIVASVQTDTSVPAPQESADAGLRQQVRSGNLQLRPTAESTDSPQDKKRASIRQAVGTTKVASKRAVFGA